MHTIDRDKVDDRMAMWLATGGAHLMAGVRAEPAGDDELRMASYSRMSSLPNCGLLDDGLRMASYSRMSSLPNCGLLDDGLSAETRTSERSDL